MKPIIHSLLNFAYLLLLAFFIPTLAQGQTVLITDSADQKPIPYAHVLFYQNGEISGGTYSNTNGVAVLPNVEDLDSVEVSSLGYYPESYLPKDLPKEVFLKVDITILTEAVVTPSINATTQFAGIRKKSSSYSMRAFRGFQHVTYIKNPFDQGKRIQSCSFMVRRIYTDKNAKLKVIFFQNDNGKPGKELHKGVVVEMTSIKSKNVVINLDTLNLYLPADGLFAGFEWMGCIDESENPTDPFEPDKCRLAILFQDDDDTSKTNQTFVRNVFKYSEWYDLTGDLHSARLQIPIIGFRVYD